MNVLFRKLILHTILAILITANGAGGATFEIQLIQNDHPSPTLLSCKIVVEGNKVSITGTGYSSPLQGMFWQVDRPKPRRFANHLVSIEDNQLASNLLMIAKHFELCHQGSDMKLVSGGVITKIECINDPESPVKEAYYIAVDESKRCPNLMEDICRDIQLLVASDFANDEGSRKKSLELLRTKSTMLATNISAYTEAFSLLEDAHQKQLPADWMKIADRVRFRPDQPPLEERSRLVRTAHEVLTASCSESGLLHIFGSEPSDERALILKIGEVRRCRGEFSYPENTDWGFDDETMSLGLVYPPHDPGSRVGILDMGIERLVLHFLLDGVPGAPTAYDRFCLAISGRDWSLIERWKFKNEAIPESTNERLHYLSAQSGLLKYLLNGEIPDSVRFLDIQMIAIEDDRWKAARIDYRLDSEEYVLPLYHTQGSWKPYRPWTERAYRHVGDSIRNKDYFRPHGDVEKHSAAAKDAGAQPASNLNSKPGNGDKTQPEAE